MRNRDRMQSLRYLSIFLLSLIKRYRLLLGTPFRKSGCTIRNLKNTLPTDLAILTIRNDVTIFANLSPLIFGEIETGAFRSYGVPSSISSGTIGELGGWTLDGMILGSTPNGGLDLAGGKGENLFIKEGFSGSPVWSDVHEVAAGIVIGGARAHSRAIALSTEGLRFKLRNSPYALSIRRLSKPLQLRVKSFISVPIGLTFIPKPVEKKEFTDAISDSSVSMIEIIGPGGSGKSTLLHHLISDANASGLSSFRNIFAWSFQHHDDILDGASVDAFLNSACEFFNVQLPEDLQPGTRGSLLGQHVFEISGALIIDGFEVVLEKIDDFVSDTYVCVNLDIKNLIFELRNSNQFMCIMASRFPIHDIAQLSNCGWSQIRMKPLTERDIRNLFAESGVVLDVKEHQDMMDALLPDPLSATLIVNYSRKYLSRTPPTRAELEVGSVAASQFGLLDSLLSNYWEMFNGQPELDILRTVSLFEGKVPVSDLLSLIEKYDFPHRGFWDCEFVPGSADWNGALFELQELGLIQINGEGVAQSLSTHHSIRAFFRRHLLEENPKAFQHANSMIFQHSSDMLPNVPKSISQLNKMYAAIRHGCLAHRWMDAYDEFFKKRIHGEDYTALWQFSSFSTEMNALAYFFDKPFETPLSNIDPWVSAETSGQAGFCLQTCGRVKEAVAPMKHSYEKFMELKDYDQAATSARNLSETYNHLSSFSEAFKMASKGDEISQDCGFDIIRISCLVERMRAAYQGLQLRDLKIDLHKLSSLMRSVEQEIDKYKNDQRLKQYAVIKALVHYYIFQICSQRDDLVCLLTGNEKYFTPLPEILTVIPEAKEQDLQVEEEWCRIHIRTISSSPNVPFVTTIFEIMKVRLGVRCALERRDLISVKNYVSELPELLNRVEAYLPFFIRVSAYLDCAFVAIMGGDHGTADKLSARTVELARSSNLKYLLLLGLNFRTQMHVYLDQPDEAIKTAKQCMNASDRDQDNNYHPSVRFSASVYELNNKSDSKNEEY